jgi:hypothetical protein
MSPINHVLRADEIRRRMNEISAEIERAQFERAQIAEQLERAIENERVKQLERALENERVKQLERAIENERVE